MGFHRVTYHLNIIRHFTLIAGLRANKREINYLVTIPHFNTGWRVITTYFYTNWPRSVPKKTLMGIFSDTPTSLPPSLHPSQDILMSWAVQGWLPQFLWQSGFYLVLCSQTTQVQDGPGASQCQCISAPQWPYCPRKPSVKCSMLFLQSHPQTKQLERKQMAWVKG